MGRVRETLHDVLRQTDAVLLALCVASTLYGMVLIASATSFRGTLKYVAVQGLGLLIGLALYFFLSSIDIFELAKQWKWLLGFNVGFLLLLLTPFGQTRNGNRAWLGVNDIGKNLGVGFLRNFPVTVQPAEVVKIFFIVLLAYQLALLKDRRDLVRFENVIQPTTHTAFMVGLIVVISGCVKPKEAYQAVDWGIIFLILGMLCVGEAMSKTGLAKAIAFGVVDNIGPMGCLVAISGLYLICSILTEMISNNAVAAVMGPLAYEMALQFDANPIPFILAVMFGASASFSTPIGYQTNTYVYNAGGYKFKDFVKVGLPLNILLWIIFTCTVGWLYPLK